MQIRTCQECKLSFPTKVIINGCIKKLHRRLYCLNCRPFGERPKFYMGALKYTKEQLIEATAKSYSIRQLMQSLGLNASGGGYKSIKTALKNWNISTEHFTGMLWNKGRTFAPRRTIQEYLHDDENKPHLHSHGLKLRLIKENILKHECNICHLSTWNDQPIPIELDHINGNHEDDRLENLRILCPNCHAQTPTHAGKNQKKQNFENAPTMKRKISKTSLSREASLIGVRRISLCEKCGDRCSNHARICGRCFNDNRNTKIIWPPITELIQRVKDKSYLAVGRELGVSDNAIRKHIIQHTKP